MGRYEDFRWVTAEFYDHLQPFPDTVLAMRALAT